MSTVVVILAIQLFHNKQYKELKANVVDKLRNFSLKSDQRSFIKSRGDRCPVSLGMKDQPWYSSYTS